MSNHRILKKLSYKFTAGFILLALLISATTCTIGYLRFQKTIQRLYNDTAYTVANVARSYVDGDAISGYLETGTVDGAYREMAEKLDRLLQSAQVNYLFLYVPQGDAIHYIYDAANGHAPQMSLGATDPISQKHKDLVLEIFRTGVPSKNYFISKSAYGYNTSAILPIFNHAGDVTALVNVDIAMTIIQTALRDYLIAAVGLGSLLVCLFLFGYLAYLRKKVIEPIKLITENALAFAEERKGFSSDALSIRTGDEIETLARALGRMETDINAYVVNLARVTADKERISAELNVAKTIQGSMLPSIFPPFPEREDIDLYAFMNPAKEVGGDFYDFFMVDDTHLCFVIADVSGKGIPAALFMVIAKTLIKNQAQLHLPPNEILNLVNRQLCEGNEALMFVTALVCVLDLRTGIIEFANAGHNPPVLMRRDGTCELVKMESGMILACVEELDYEPQRLSLQPGDQLYLYTDGVTEAMNPAGELFGEKRLLDTLSHATGSLKQIQGSLQAAILAFADGADQADDITMLNIRYLAPDPPNCLTVSAKLENLYDVRDFIAEHVAGTPFAGREEDLQVCAEEIFVNIASYAYPESQTGKVSVRCLMNVDPSSIELVFQDWGAPYNPLMRPDPDLNASLEERPIGGLGIYMVKQTMSKVDYRYENGMNILTMLLSS